MEEHTILFVDDEKNILRTLQRLFMDEPYRLLLANSGQEGLDLLLAGERPKVIVSDQRMPSMGGVEFLMKAKELAPESIRIVLTGYADINAAIDAVNLGGVSRYLMKPWNDDDLKLVIHHAVERFDLISRNQELTEALAEKNQLLEELNKGLEEKVEERTRDLSDAFQKNLALTSTLQKKVKELEGRDAIQRHMLTIHPIDETLKVVLEAIAPVLEADGAGIYMHPEVDGDGMPMPRAFFPSQALPVMAVDHQEVFADHIRVVGTTGEAFRAALPATGGEEVFSFAVAPVRKDESMLGVLVVTRKSPRILDDGEMKTMASFAGLAAIAIHDSQLGADISTLGLSLDEVLGG